MNKYIKWDESDRIGQARGCTQETGRKRASKRTSSISAKKQASSQTMPISEEKRMSAHIASIVVPTTKSWAAFALASPSISKGESQSFGDSEPSLSP